MYLLKLISISVIGWVSLFGDPTKVDEKHYIDDIKVELVKTWPKNRAINLVFHGHSVPAGYFNTPNVRTMQAYPNVVLGELKEQYPYAVINVIKTCIGGENSVSGAKRFESDVLIHKPDVLFIDYVLNDLSLDMTKTYEAWEFMILKAKERDIKVILLTPTADKRYDILSDETTIAKHRLQIIELAKKHEVGLVDSYQAFRDEVSKGTELNSLMSQVNHPNEKGHQLVVKEIMKFF
ncbi:SGNH/GDSL hydrolase family protein [Flammeovirga sp. MY04]|uniref:SGNH/GDSL hydrolase family protein n=1 Tax=Flammeovirga sp. MY04 TaxID=1191459 RepID=UPI0008063CBF|nr:GDSL-type esterase/lipase family protein [Flammeovirga sp. MY04]ANQ51665.1 SGNH/GDSL hydrolase family protein [Flammeovirga sp. MY04]